MITYRNLFLPIFFNFLCLKKKNEKTTSIYIYNNIIFMKLRILDKNLLLNKETHNIKILINNKHINNNIFTDNIMRKFLKELYSYYFIKIKFKGKGYKINLFRKKKTIQFFFGVSHIKIVMLKQIILKKLTKYKFFLKSKNVFLLNKISKKILNVRYINPYTLRGLRLSKMNIIKRKGKKGVWI